MARQRLLALIPARGGSKRVPGKNIRELGGRPLIAWTIGAARDAGLFDRVVVSTDCPAIAAVAREHGAEVPFLRPDRLAGDTAGTLDVVEHALDALAPDTFDAFCLLQPTSPFRTAAHIRAARDLMLSRQADNVVSVTPCEHSPLWSNTLPPDGSLAGFLPAHLAGVRSQDLPPYYRLNGALYWLSAPAFRQARRFLLDERAYAFVMENRDSVDIDTELDFLFARFLHRQAAGGDADPSS